LKIGYWLNKAIKQESMRHIMHLPLFHQERLSKGDYVYRQNVVTNSLSELVLGTTSSITESIIVIVGVLAIMLFFNVQLTIITVVLIPFLFITMRIIGPKMGVAARKLTEVASETSSRINESVDNAETVQAFTLEDKLLNKITRLWDKGFELSKKNLLWGELLSGTNGFLIVLSTSLVMYLGGSAALRGEMSLGELLIFMTYMGYLLGPVESLVEQITSRNQKLIDVGRIYEVLADHEGIEYLRSNAHMPGQITGQIEFKNVSYSYNDQPIFKNLNLTIPAGQKISIIGPSGGGKSTIMKLLPLFLEPESGQILIDNIDIESVSLKELRQHISWVAQTPQLFEGTIIDNLTDGDAYREVSNEEILDAIETANVSEFAAKLPLGLASPAGENGGSLSGGQRQRVSIARALVKNAPIVCLDEPTAALDAKSENYIRDSLMQMIQGKTVVMVTHRKSLLALMDVVYVLDNGTLTDVNQLGGLDHYLAQLEGIEEQKAAVESKQSEVIEKANTEQLISDYQQFVQSQEPEQKASAIQAPEQTQLAAEQPINPATQGVKPWQPNSTPIQPGNNDRQPQSDNPDDITINLH
jgi:ABC-type bacteriocin/lantibiotic exporter with double-glycine peptidase domain